MMLNFNCRGVCDMTNNNFKWLINDINSSLVLKVIYKKNDVREEYAIFDVFDVVGATGDKINIETANIDDLTKFLTLGMVRFVNTDDISDILDVPFRNLNMLYQNGNIIGVDTNKLIPMSKLEAFSIIDGSVKNEYFVFSALINDISDDLKEMMKIASEFGSYGMQEKFVALDKITMINHYRLMEDNKNRNLR